MTLAISAMADNVTPSKASNFEIAYNGYNYLKVNALDLQGSVAKVKIYTSNFDLLHTERLSVEGAKLFDVSQLDAGSYIVRIEKDGVDVYTEVIRKIKN